MANCRFELNKAGVGNILKSKEIESLTRKYAASYEGNPKTFIGFDRAKTIMYRGRKK